MKKLFFYSIAVIMAIVFMASKEKPVKLFLAGDSTMADKPMNSCPERGWGMVLPSYFDDNVLIENHARNGRSTRTFISEGRWDFMLNRVAKGDFVVIQFGHNDQSKEKEDRYTPPVDYKNNLALFVSDVRKKGATPILCTPVERRKFDNKGNFVDQHGNYPNLVRQVADSMKVALIDMQHTSMDLIIEKGEEGSKDLFLHVGAGVCEKYPEGKEDNTHFKDAGAMAMAQLFINGLKQLNIEPLVKNLRPADKVQLQYTIQIPNLDKLKSATNSNLDEGVKK